MTLLNFSGGIDSLYCLWQYALSKTPLLIHYCELQNWTKRHEQERVAVAKILGWIDKHLPFEYTYLKSSFDYGNLSIVKDKEVIGFMTGVILRDKRHEVDSVIISSNKEDVSRLEYYTESEADRIRLMEGVGHKKVKYLYPIKDKTKAELISELPKDLLSLSWFCRIPKSGKPCGKCKTCKTVLPHV